MRHYLRQTLWLGTLALSAVGCSDGPDAKMVSVTGTVKFADGSIPTGERAEIIFEPTAGEPGQLRKMAFGQINPEDGRFEMTTVKPGDGVIAGKYKVIFAIHKTAIDLESLVAEKYTRPDKSPYEVTVESGVEPFEFEVERP